MRRVAFAFVLLAACGGPARDATEVTIAAQGTPLPPVAPQAPVGPLDVTMPAYAAAKLILAPIMVKRAATGMFSHADGSPSNEQRDLEEALGVGAGAASGERILDTLGIDPSRPIAIAAAALDAGGRARVARLEAIAAKLGRTVNDSLRVDAGELLRAFGTEPAFARVRVRVPVQDAAVAKRALRRLLTKADLRESAAPPGVDLVMSSRSVTVAMSSDGAWLVADVYLEPSDGGRPRPDVLASIRALRAEGERGEEPASLGDLSARATLVPTKIAEMGFVSGVQETMAALANVNADLMSRIAATGIVEAHRSIELAGNDRGSYFTRFTIEARGAGPRLTFHATGSFGAAFEASAHAAAGRRGDRRLDYGKVKSAVEASLAAGLAFPITGDGRDGPADAAVFSRSMHEAGWPGWLLAAPLTPLFLMTVPVRPPPDAFEPSSAALKLERVALVEPDPGQGELFLGLLRAGTTDQEAACVLTGATPCSSHALRPGAAAVKMGTRFARVLRSGDRFVVIVGDQPGTVDALKPSVSVGSDSSLSAFASDGVVRGPAAAILFGDRSPKGISMIAENAGSDLDVILYAR